MSREIFNPHPGDLLIAQVDDPAFPYPVIYLGYYSSEEEDWPWDKPVHLIWDPDRGPIRQHRMGINAWKIISRL